jgi:hypothetical protein
LNRSFDARIEKTIELVNANNNQKLFGFKKTDTLSKLIDNCVNVQGSDKSEFKAKHLNGFADNQFQTLITKLL